MAMILLSRQGETLYARPCRIRRRDRIGARLAAWQLDHALARGASPDSSVALSLHAHRLLGPAARRALARALRDLPQDAAQPRSRLNSAVPICWRQVLEAGATLNRLADRLDGREPVEALGVATLRVLLRDGCSPLFDPRRAQELELTLHRALDALQCGVAA